MKINVIKPYKQYKSRNIIEIKNLKNELIAEMDFIPSILLGRIVDEIREKRYIELDYIKECFSKARSLFINEKIDGTSYEEYLSNVHLVSGIPINSLKRSVEELIDSLTDIPKYIYDQVPVGAEMLKDKKILPNKVYWMKKGQIISVIAAGNNPLTNKGWLECLAAGYKVIVKPSVTEPFTAYRLVNSLISAGIPEDFILFLPGKHDMVDKLIDCTDFSIVYGNESTIKKYNNVDKVIFRGPGRSKIFWDKDYDNYNIEYIQRIIIDSILKDGGMKCINTSGIVYDKVNSQYMDYIYDEILKQNTNGFFDENAVLPLMNKSKAVDLANYLDQFVVKNDIQVINNGSSNYYEEIEDDICIMKPFIGKVNNINDNILKFELGFPAIWTYELKNESDLEYFKNSLLLLLFSNNKGILNDCILEPSIKKVITKFDKDKVIRGMPHDGYLLSKVFEAKAIL